MRVGELARRTGVGVSTLRAWESRFGVLEPTRSASGQRLYDEADVERVGTICRLVTEGLTLSAAIGRVANAGPAAAAAGEDEAFLLRQLVQAVDQGICVVKYERTRYVNRRMAEMMRCSIDDLLARPIQDFVDPEYLPVVEERARLVREGHRLRFDAVLRRADLSTFVAEVSAAPLFHPSGEYDGAVSVITDVTERRASEAEARFRNALLDSIGEAVLASRPDGIILYANPAAERLFGWRAAEMIGQSGLELLPAQRAAADSRQVHRRLLAGRRQSRDLELTRRDGSRFVAHVTGTPVLDEHGQPNALIAVLSDNGERNQMVERARARDQWAETVAMLGTQALRAGRDDQDLLLREAVEATRRALRSEHSALFEVPARGGELRMRVSSPDVDYPAAVPSGSRSLAGYAALAGRVVVVDDARQDHRFDLGPGQAQLETLSAIAAPVFGPSGVRGVLVSASKEPDRFDQSTTHFMQGIANVVATVLREPPEAAIGRGKARVVSAK
ncbi:MAG TPA: PAS domain S-box protein [Acidimicrobiales bacterium]|nr:PAS domain S-box protein [Acidimicrobiales bacterium]